MIAELFYPKELKELIADLRAKDDLNEEALKNMSWDVLRYFFPCVLICVLIVSHQIIFGFNYLIITLLIILSVLSLRFLFKRVWSVYYLTYLNGIRNHGVVTKVSYSRNGDRYILVTNKDHLKSDTIHVPASCRIETPDKNDEIIYLTSPNLYSVLYSKKMLSRYCIKKIETKE